MTKSAKKQSIVIKATTVDNAIKAIRQHQKKYPKATYILTNPENTIDLLGATYMHALINTVKKHYPNIQGCIDCSTDIGQAMIALKYNVDSISIQTNESVMEKLHQWAYKTQIIGKVIARKQG